MSISPPVNLQRVDEVQRCTYSGHILGHDVVDSTKRWPLISISRAYKHCISAGSVLLAWGHEQHEWRPWRVHRAKHRGSAHTTMYYAEISYVPPPLSANSYVLSSKAVPVGTPAAGGGANFFTGKTPWRQCFPPSIGRRSHFCTSRRVEMLLSISAWQQPLPNSCYKEELSRIEANWVSVG